MSVSNNIVSFALPENLSYKRVDQKYLLGGYKRASQGLDYCVLKIPKKNFGVVLKRENFISLSLSSV